MAEQPINPPKQLQQRYNSQALAIIVTIGIVLSVWLSIVVGHPVETLVIRSFYWIAMLALALFADKLCRFINQVSEKKISKFLPYLFCIPPTMYLISDYFEPIFLTPELFYTISALTTCMLYIYIAWTLSIHLKAIVSRISIDPQNEITKPKETSKSTTTLDDISSKSPVLTRVIDSIRNRALSYHKSITVSLIAMIVIVAIGGGASFGTVALSEANKIRDLEAVRVNMLRIANELEVQDSSQFRKRDITVKTLITKHFGNEKSYQETLESIENQADVSWPDIAMRITIAALTLFLVQVFFHIYKYNQRQASHLYTKAETLELFTEEGAEMDTLRAGLLAKMDPHPNFEKSPTTPTENIINVIGKGGG